MTLDRKLHTREYRQQRTLKSPVAFSGIGVHTGQQVAMRFCPALENTGILFKRIDLPQQPIIPATVSHVCDTLRSTTLGCGEVRVHTVEHVLAALKAFDIDNLVIEISNVEPPIGDGSASAFVKMIEESGVIEQDQQVAIVKVQTPIYWTEGNIHLVALPCDSFRISYTLNYPNNKILRSQYCTLVLNQESFCREIASSRTFSLYEEVALLMDRGLIRGGSLDNAVIIKDDAVFSKDGLRYSDEMVRHKVLDLIGDLSLAGFPFHAHVIAIRSGHASNFQLAKLISNHALTENF